MADTAAATAANAFRRKKAQLDKALEMGQLTRKEYAQGLAKASNIAQTASGKAGKIAAAGVKAATGRTTIQKMAAGLLKGRGNAALTAATVAAPFVSSAVKNLNPPVRKVTSAAGKDQPKHPAMANPAGSAARDKAQTMVKATQRNSKPSTAKSGTQGTPKPSSGSTARSGTYTVKSGDSLWKIASKNGTTVQALLKANPSIASRRKAGKVDIFSGSKVHIPKGKK